MIQIENVNPIRKGSLLAICDVYIKPWHLRLHEVRIFERGVNRWIGLPSKEFVNAAGEKKYIELLSFDSEAVKGRFRDQIVAAVDKFLETNPEMEAEAVIKDEELPF